MNWNALVLTYSITGAHLFDHWCSLIWSLVLTYSVTGAHLFNHWCSLIPSLVLTYSNALMLIYLIRSSKRTDECGDSCWSVKRVPWSSAFWCILHRAQVRSTVLCDASTNYETSRWVLHQYWYHILLLKAWQMTIPLIFCATRHNYLRCRSQADSMHIKPRFLRNKAFLH